MFVGTYYHNLESKGRFSLPKIFRQETTDWVLTAGLDGCLFIFKRSEFDSEVEKLTKLSYYQADHRALVRHFAQFASMQVVDSLGRLTLSDDLQKIAGLDKQLVIVGALTRLEIWEPTRYHQFFDNLAHTIDSQAEKLVLP